MPFNVVQDEVHIFSSDDYSHVVGGSTVTPAAAVAGNAEITFAFGLTNSTSVPSAHRRKKVEVLSIDVQRATGASATNYTPAVADVSGATSTDWSVKVAGAATAPDTRFDEVEIHKPMYTDAAGKIYFKLNGDAADTFKYAVAFKILG